MARSGLVQRERGRQGLVNKYCSVRRHLRVRMGEASSLDGRWEISKELQSLPRNSAPTRLRRRCSSTGRPRANYRDFGLSRHVLREMANACLLPGLVRSSW
uniref:Small ribosomal subunit protein uS14c n=1 Tax=Selaginella lepidophylla TaxID=59777 RepID=A0A3Q9R2M3_SELLP|nr:ribosomal protein S14 [Selaginella lepidophylla]AZU95903.1 ribosomal protein S14 [Selaginella lepidophylla]